MVAHRLPHPSLSTLFERGSGRLNASPMPAHIAPMLPIPGTDAFDDPLWTFEPDHGGQRLLCHLDPPKVTFLDAKGHKRHLSKITTELRNVLPLPAMLDGELVRHGRQPILYIFDLLYIDRHDIRDWTLHERKEVLRKVLRPHKSIHLTPDLPRFGKKALADACRGGHPAIVAKRLASPYVSAKSGDWVRIPCPARQKSSREIVMPKPPAKSKTPAQSSLAEYNRKRTFSETPEPAPQKPKKAGKKPIFVIQEHHASRLHYDFRLESDGVLISWAVPKEPTDDPAVKRLAVRTEDHPIAYAKFHGDIPEGHYGAGHVDICDKGTFANLRSPDAKSLAKDLAKGHVKVSLHGKRLQGAYSLIRLSNQKKENWLLFKSKET
jgi:DNA ligase D-like protein (predicted 3'-phosphoesterase)